MTTVHIPSGSGAATRRAFGRCKSVNAQVRADFAAVAAIVIAEPGLLLKQIADRIRGRVSWRDPLDTLQRHARSGSGRFRAAGLQLVRDGSSVRVWPRDDG